MNSPEIPLENCLFTWTWGEGAPSSFFFSFFALIKNARGIATAVELEKFLLSDSCGCVPLQGCWRMQPLTAQHTTLRILACGYEIILHQYSMLIRQENSVGWRHRSKYHESNSPDNFSRDATRDSDRTCKTFPIVWPIFPRSNPLRLR